MSRPGLQTPAYTPVFGAPSTSGLKSATAQSGLGALQPGSVDAATGMVDETILQLREMAKQFNVAPPEPEAQPENPFIAFSPSRREMYVNGFTFREDDAEAALESEQYLGQSKRPEDPGDWMPLPSSTYQSYLESIKNPGLGRRFAKSATGGFGSLQEMWGAALLTVSDGDLGRGVYEKGKDRSQRNSPFMKQFTEIKDADDALDWFAATLGQAAPFLAESLLAGLIGAGIGGAVGSATAPGAGTAAGAVGGAVVGAAGREAVKATLMQAVKKKLAGEVLSKSEHMLLSRATGAAIGLTTSGYTTGFGDIRAEQMDQGVADADGAVGAATFGAVPYALLNAIPEMGAGWLLFRQGTRAAQRTGLQTAGTYAGRVAGGVAVGGALEGAAELGQEALVVGGSEQFGAEYSDEEKRTRWIEAFAGGAAVGGAIGGPVNLLRKRVKPEAPTTPTAAPSTTPEPPDGPTFADGIATPGMADPAGILGTPGLRPPPPATPPPPGVAGTGPDSGYMGGLQLDPDEVLGAPPVLPGQDGMLFQDQDLGPAIAQPVAQPAMEPPAVEPGQQALLTSRGQPAATAEKKALWGAQPARTVTPKQRAAVGRLVTAGKDMFPPAAAKAVLETTDVVVGATKFAVDTLFNNGAQSVITLDFYGFKTPTQIAYDEGIYGSPQQFAEAMGFDYAMLDTGKFTRTMSDGASTAALDIAEYMPRPNPMARKERQTDPAKSPLKRGIKDRSRKKESTPDDVPERSPAPLDEGEQARTGARDGGKDTAGSPPARKIARKTKQAAKPAEQQPQEKPAPRPLKVPGVEEAAKLRDQLGKPSWMVGEEKPAAPKTLKKAKPPPGSEQAKKAEAEEKIRKRLERKALKEEGAKAQEKKAEEIVSTADKAREEFTKAKPTVLLNEASTMEGAMARSAKAERSIQLIMELRRRVQNEQGTEQQLTKMSEMLLALSEAKATRRLFEEAQRRMDGPGRFSRTPEDGDPPSAQIIPFTKNLKTTEEVNRDHPVDPTKSDDAAILDLVAEKQKLDADPALVQAKLMNLIPVAQVEAAAKALQKQLEADAKLAKALDKASQKRITKLIREKKLRFSEGELFNTTGENAFSVPWIVMRHYAHPTDADVYGYVVWNPLYGDGMRRVLVNDTVNSQMERVTRRDDQEYFDAISEGYVSGTFDRASKIAAKRHREALMRKGQREALELRLADLNINKGERFVLPGGDNRPMKYTATFVESVFAEGVTFTDQDGKTVRVRLPTGPFETTPEGMDLAQVVAQWKKFEGPKGKFSRSEFGGAAKAAIKAVVDRVLANVSPEFRKKVKITYTENQGTLFRDNPALYRRAVLARQTDLDRDRTAVGKDFEDWFNALPMEVKRDTTLRGAMIHLFEDVQAGTGELLLNPTSEEALALHFRKSNDYGVVKFLQTEDGNVIAFHTSGRLHEHADAAATFGMAPGEFARGYLAGADPSSWFEGETVKPKARTQAQRVEDTDKYRVTMDELLSFSQDARTQMALHEENIFQFREVTSDAAQATRYSKVLLDIMKSRATGRVPNDFETTSAAGFRVGDQIILFTDNIKDDAHAALVIAEELVGHFGLTELLGRTNMEPVMQAIYEDNASVRAAADAFAARNKNQDGNLTISEAVEEVLAQKIATEVAMENGFDFSHAPQLFVEPGILGKAINAIKRLLNKLFGKRTLFDDEMVRQLIAASKRDAVTGQKTHFNLRGIVGPTEVNEQGMFSRPRRGGPTRAEKLPPAYYEVLGETLGEIYELTVNGASNAFLAENLGYSGDESVRSTLTKARSKLRAAGLEDISQKQATGAEGKTQEIMKLAATRDEDGNYLSVMAIAERLNMSKGAVSASMSRERARFTDQGKAVPDYLFRKPGRPTSGRFSRTGTFEYGQATGPLYNPQRPVPRDLEQALDWFKLKKTNMGQLGKDVLNAVKTMNFASRSNAGYREGYRILTDTKNTVAQLRAKYNALLEDVLRNTDRGARLEVSKMLQFTAQAKLVGLSDKKLRELPRLFTVVGNEINIDPAAFEQLSRMGRFTIKEFQQGVSRDVEVSFTENGKAETRVEKLTLPAMPDLKEDSKAWQLYVQTRDAMDQAALDRVRADYAAAFGARENTYRKIEGITGKKLSEPDRKFVEDVDKMYRELARKGAKEDADGKLVYDLKSLDAAQEFMADFNRVLIARNEDKALIRTFAERFPEAQRAEISAAISSFRKDMTFKDSTKFDVQRVVTDLAALELGKEDSELFAKRSIAGGYVPIGRTGGWQVRIRAVDPKTGQVYGLDEKFRAQLPYFQTETRGEANALAGDVDKLFPAGQTTMELPVFDSNTKEYVIKSVRLEAVAEAARETPTSDPGINMNEFMRLITRYGVSLNPQERERIVIGMTEQNSRARSNLQRQNVPGQDPDSIPYISQHLESLANITGRRMHQHRIDILMDDQDQFSQRLWNGDPEELKRLRTKHEDLKNNPMSPQAAVELAKRELDDYAFMMRRTKEEGGANVFKDRFTQDLAYLEQQKSLEYADFASDGIGQTVRTWTAVAQLGGSFATGALNIISIPLNVLPALASYNAGNGFGGGFGMGRSAAALSTALAQVGGMGKYKAGYYDNLVNDKAALAKSGLTLDEAQFLAKEIAYGNLQAALTNALTASAKGKFGRNPTVQRGIDAYMSYFTYTEQASRRASALAAYRLERDRQLDAGMSADVASRAAEQFAIDMSNFGLGNYSMYNRPGAFRGGLRDFVFMYKMYPITAVQLMSALDTKGKAMMITALWLTSGLKGLPFAEDILDLLDTIMQKLGLKAASAEALAIQTIEEFAPGLSPYVLRGVIDQMVPATVSSRTGLGNMIPGTSMFVAGANQYREVMDFVGPAASAIEGTVTVGGKLAQGTLSATGISQRNVEGSDILRSSPITMMRAAGDMLAYLENDAIVDSKGYVATRDLGPGTYIARAAGFYPAAASRQNDVVRLTKRQADYMREVSSEYRRAYVKAALRGDRDKMRQTVENVRDWNRAARGTGLEIPNFAVNAQRAVQEAKKTSSDRFATSAPRSLKKNVRELQDAFGADE